MSDPVISDTPCPVTIVGGYLGSGKTTLINHLLSKAHGCRLAILVNDFGELAIDAQLIEARDGNVISLSGGCVCCSYGNDLTGALLQLDLNSIDQVLIESSGVALPGAIASSLSLLRGFVVSGVVVLVDASTIAQYAEDKYLADTIDRQLQSADLIAINKSDLITGNISQEINTWLGVNYATAKVVNVENSIIPEALLIVSNGPVVNIQPAKEAIYFAEHDASIYCTFILQLDERVDIPALARKLAARESGLLRAKGFVQDHDGIMQTLQVVGRRWSLQVAPDGVQSGLVCIGLSEHCSEPFVKALIAQA